MNFLGKIFLSNQGEKMSISQIHSEKKEEKRNLCRFADNDKNLYGRDQVYLCLFLA